MTTLDGVKWVEWFSLAMLFVTLAFPLFFMWQAWRRHFLDDLDCSKFEVFSTDTAPGGAEMPEMPYACRPGFIAQRPWAHAINVEWIWVTLAIAVIWGLIMLGAFIASRGIEALRVAAPV